MERRVLLAIFLSSWSCTPGRRCSSSRVPKPGAPGDAAGRGNGRSARGRRPRRCAPPAPARRRRPPQRLKRRRLPRSSATRRSATSASRRADVDRGVHEPRRAAQELAAEALPRSAGRAAGARPNDLARRSRCRSRCGRRTTHVDATLERRVCTPSPARRTAPDRRRRPICDSSTATPPACTRSRSSISTRRRYVDRVYARR